MSAVIAALPSFAGLVDRGGYLGLGLVVFVEGFGVPAPGETAIIAVAGLAARGHLNVFVAAAIAFLAAVAGDGIGYLIGRTGGRALILRYGRFVRLDEARLHRMETFMDRHGPKVVTVARFVEGLRQLNGVVAGASGMPWRRFVIFNALGAALWVGAWTTAGYLAGDHLDAITAAVHRYLWYTLAAAALAAAAYLLWHRRRSHRA